MIYTLVVLILSISHSFSAEPDTNIKAMKAFSIQITSDLLAKELRNNKMMITQNLDLPMQKLKDCKAIGSISNINLQGSQDLQFYFKYNLNSWASNLQITIFARPQFTTKFSQQLSITLDFLIAEFPSSYYIFTENITSYQTHIEHETNRDYELIFYLNGFNNFSKSGNITHSYQLGYGIYTVHYMSCEGEEGNMGWREDIDYNFFTLMVVPMKGLIQKFKIQEKSYSIDQPIGFQFFYGIKGATDQEFVGGFQRRMGGLIFKAKHLSKAKTYGLVFLPYPGNSEIKDSRADNSYPISHIIGIVSFVFVITIIICYFLCQRFYFLKRMIKWREDEYEIQENQGSKSDLKNSKRIVGRPKYDITTVEQVEQKYESSRKSSRKNSFKSKVNEVPSFKFKQ